MKDIDHAGKANGVNGPVCIAVFIADHLPRTSTAKALQCLGPRMFIAVLRIVDRKTHDAPNLVRERPQVVSRRSDPYGGLWSSHWRSLLIAVQLTPRQQTTDPPFQSSVYSACGDTTRPLRLDPGRLHDRAGEQN